MTKTNNTNNDVEPIAMEYKFSVLMSVYYNENPTHFREALDSILVNQELKPHEFVLVVDGPVPNELNMIIEEYTFRFADTFFVYRLEENCGLGIALNYGIEKCSYNLIARVDSDDINDPERFKLQLMEFTLNSDLDVLGSSIDEFIENYKEPVYEKKMPISHLKILNMSKFRNPINHMTVMFKKNTVLTAGSYDHLPYLEDYFLWIKMLNIGGNFKNIDRKLVHVRIGNGMLTRRSNRKYISSWKKLNKYMINNKMVNLFEYSRNILSIYVFIYTPVQLKNVLYKFFLRS